MFLGWFLSGEVRFFKSTRLYNCHMQLNIQLSKMLELGNHIMDFIYLSLISRRLCIELLYSHPRNDDWSKYPGGYTMSMIRGILINHFKSHLLYLCRSLFFLCKNWMSDDKMLTTIWMNSKLTVKICH